MSVSSQTLRCCFTPLSSSSSSNHQWRRAASIRCSPSPSLQEPLIPSRIELLKPLPPSPDEDNPSNSSGIQVPRHRYISVSKSELLDAIVSSMFPSPEEATQFLSLSQSLDSILHAEHKTILEEMRCYYDDLTLSTKTNADDFPPVTNGDSEHEGDETDSKSNLSLPFGFTLDFNSLFDFSSSNDERNYIKASRTAIPGHFQRSLMRLLKNAEFEELSPRDLMLTSALNTDYLLTLPIYVDWKRASLSSVIVFRRGYTTERQKGLLIAEKLDYLQSKLLQNIIFLIAKPMGRLGVWLDEIIKSIIQIQDTGVLAKRFKRWLDDMSLSLKSYSYDGKIFDELDGIDIFSSEFPIWVTAQKAVTLYEGILSESGPRERLLRKFLAWVGLVPSIPEEAFDLHLDSSSSGSNLSPSFLPRISLSDIWKPASPRYCGNDFRKMLRTAISVLFSRSILQEPAFQELILLYTENNEDSETPGQAEVPSLQMKIYERIPIPDLPVVFPHKQLSFRILDAVRLDAATILGLLAYFFSYKFVNILSSPSAIFLDAVAATAFGIYTFRVLLGYKQTRDRYQLLVNRTLYEKTVASGFGSIHFLLDASEQQQYKEAILVYATLLTAESDEEFVWMQVKSTKGIAHKCEAFMYDVFQEKVEMGVEKAIDTLLRLGLVVKNGVDEVNPIPCATASIILRNRWNTLIN
ncbi:uncharacterized protein LOC121778126 isoform X1 [Salvia splendens]|uniref:uncharacterized protein LOC121778126 isoform X1 n=1 Tax=Salvia splendens TaxID=180675 RepID=UPI001C26046B|nr:uncharacterized protein LOC121778126 isoform X1 [Salvia splendens]XP_042031363.1 uncharacterized protein LOC121778126 isoform X1 [Salvia splendens]XP_042031364.1 uncharacterized protein LOC121778126 isoform X1 [Salvia splendens]XP_042031365.1 uncharacterized protein LOC121778126 isoform X1 [Salvia splendens]XP_042031366.1 uncharacterized protein LOC121778126 isoform X1 [Salvia splendens]